MRSTVSFFLACTAALFAAQSGAACDGLAGTFLASGEETDIQSGVTKQISMNDRLSVKGVNGATFRFAADPQGRGYQTSVLDSAGTEVHLATVNHPAFKCESSRLSRRVQFEASGDGNPSRNDFELNVFLDGGDLVLESRRRTERINLLTSNSVRLVHTVTRYAPAPAK